MRATLMLQDGFSIAGEAIGASGERAGKVILNTAVVGYQEMATDPANAGKILVLTYPLIGNYGVAPKFCDSARCWLSALVIKEKSKIYSNWQAKSSFDEFIKEQNLLVLSEIDTRTLTVHLREKGEMCGLISTTTRDKKKLLSKLQALRKNNSKSYLDKISADKPTLIKGEKAKAKIAVLDLGLTASIIRQLKNMGLSLCVFPYDTKPDQILQINLRV